MGNLDAKFLDSDTRVMFVVVMDKTPGVIGKAASGRF